MSSAPKIGLALGGGGARGLAHIAILEVFDELGIKPALIAGTSIGALVGAAYASGLTAAAIREHAERVLGNRIELARRLFRRARGNPLDLINFKLFGPVQVDGERLTGLVLPQGVAERIEAMQIPLKVVTTDFYERRELVLERGPVRTAVAASIALPGLIQAPRIDGRVLIDGGISNPLPLDLIREGMDLTVAVDVTGGPVPGERGEPTNAELAFGASQIMQRQIATLKRQKLPPDIYVAPDVDQFRVLDFFKVHDILERARPARDDLKRALENRIG